MLGQHGEEQGGGGGGVELHSHSREHWAVATRQQTDFKVELFLGVCFEESDLRSDGGAAEQPFVEELPDGGTGPGEGDEGEGGSSSRS